MSLFRCPICNQALSLHNKTYRCKKNHCYDVSKDNYVHLLPANQKSSLHPGDDKEMVNARSLFLSKGYYQCLSTALTELCLSYTEQYPCILDSGCGEGYYTNNIYQGFTDKNRNVSLAGIDISKWAVRLAAKNSTGAEYAVASAFHLPVLSGGIHLLVNCFSPLCLPEFQRVIKKGGYFLYVVPAPKHLWELKSAVYDNPYENEEKIENYKGFTHVEDRVVHESVHLANNQDTKNLFMMTPYAWKTPKDSLAKLDTLESLDVTISFHIHVYKRK